MNRKRVKELLKEAAEGVLLGIAVTAIAAGAVKINAKGADTYIPEEYRQYCEEAGQAYGICPELLEAIIEEESGGDPDAVGEAGEIGLMQIYPRYHMNRVEQLGICSLFDPESNITAGADYLAELFAQYQDPATVLMVYNGTEDAENLAEKGELTEYAKRVLQRSYDLERLHKK